MTPRTGLAGAVVQRSLADWPVVLAALVLLICATTLLATGVVYGDAVAAGGLHRAILAAPPATRAMVVSLSSEPDRLESLDAIVRPELDRAMAATGGSVYRITASGSYADAATPPDQVHDLTEFASVDGIERRATLLEGAWPTAGGTPLQAVVSDAAARQMHLTVGDRLSLVSRLDASLHVDVAIVGIWQVDPSDALFLGDTLETTGVTSGSGTYTSRGPLVIREADLVTLGGGRRLAIDWRGLPDVASLRVDDVDALRAGADDLAARLRGLLPAGTSPRVTTTLPQLLDGVGRSVLVSRSGVILLTIQFAILAGYAVILVAGLLVERRRSEIALMRSRGASGSHLTRMAVLESTLLAVPAAILAPLLALAIVNVLGSVGPTAGLGLADNAAISQTAIVVSIVAGLACIVALTLPTLFVSASPAGARAAQGRQARTTLPQRLGLDLALVAVAAVALWQLRLYGAPLTVNARGTLGLDPLLVAAPAIGLIAGAVLALRIVPRVAELGERFLVRGRGLVGSLGGRQLARRPLRYTRAALLLMLAAALGTLAAAHAATWTRSQADQAAYQAVGDVRALPSDYTSLPTWAAGPTYRAIPGVTAATPLITSPFDIGRTVRESTLVGVDPTAAGEIATTPPRGSDWTAATDALGPLRAAESPSPAIALPGRPARIALTVDVAFQQIDTTTEEPTATDLPPGTAGFSADAVLRDGDGRLWRTAAVAGSLSGPPQRIVIDLGDPSAPGLLPTAPLSLEAVELSIAPTEQIPIFGAAEITGLEVTDAATGETGWAPVTIDAAADGWQWARIDAERTDTFRPVPARPNRIAVSNSQPFFGGGSSGVVYRLFAGPAGFGGSGDPDEVSIPIIASDALMTRTGSSIGDELQLSSLGRPVNVRIVGTTPMFAPFDPDKPIAIALIADVDVSRFIATGQTSGADEWWLRVAPGSEPGVLAALRSQSAGTSSVIGRTELTRALTTDPVPLGLIGVLGLGSIAAMLFAGIGFLVSSTVSTSERVGEFALLRALGLSTSQLSLWLSIESVFLLVVGLVAGTLLGLLLAWLVLPFATLAQTGLAPVPAPVVVIPWEAILPVYVAALVLFVISLWLTRRQLPDIRISGVLRARES